MDKFEKVMKLVDAGFTAAQIGALLADPAGPEPAPAPTDPEPSPAPADPEPAPAPADPEPAPAGNTEILTAIKDLTAAIQAGNLAAAKQPPAADNDAAIIEALRAL